MLSKTDHLQSVDRCPFIHFSVNIAPNSIFIRCEIPRIPQTQSNCILYHFLKLLFFIKTVSLIIIASYLIPNIPLLDSQTEGVYGTLYLVVLATLPLAVNIFSFLVLLLAALFSFSHLKSPADCTEYSTRLVNKPLHP